MEVIKRRNAHQILPELLHQIQSRGVARETRDGKALQFLQPCTLVYEKPQERVVFWSERDANPFFHLMEALWMLCGRRDVRFVEQFVKRMKQYSDDGKNFHAAYGYRWRKHFKRDQPREIAAALLKNKDCRRQVLGIWDVRSDLERAGRDLPCNLVATFQINPFAELDMVVSNRSNDSVMGALGANCVHFSILQEYIAAGARVPMGRYWQVSSNMHLYERDLKKVGELALAIADPFRKTPACPYTLGEVVTTKVIDVDIDTWDQDLAMWMKDPLKIGLRSTFFKRVATPMLIAHRAYKKGDIPQALEIVDSQMPDKSDWKLAAKEWLERRKK
jgi:thymidylate synthase